MSTNKAASGKSTDWDFDDQFVAPGAPDIPMNLESAIGYFYDIEEKYDQAVQDQDILIRKITQRIPRSNSSGNTKGLLVPVSLTPTDRTEFFAPKFFYGEAREVIEISSKIFEKQVPMATKHFMSQAGRYEIEQIEKMEVNIATLRQQMRSVEVQIMKHAPKSSMDVVLKLKFLAVLLLDGSEVKTDYVASLIDECAEVLEDNTTMFSLCSCHNIV